MYKVFLKPRNSDSLEEKVYALFPGEFSQKDLNDYLNQIKNNKDRYRFFYQSSDDERLIPFRSNLSSLSENTQETMIEMVYEKASQNDDEFMITSLSNPFPDWIKCLSVNYDENGKALRWFSGGFDGSLRSGVNNSASNMSNEIVYNFGAECVLAIDTNVNVLVAATDKELFFMYLSDNKKILKGEMNNITSVKILKNDEASGSWIVLAGFVDGLVREFRVSRRKGFVETTSKRFNHRIQEFHLLEGLQVLILTSNSLHFWNDKKGSNIYAQLKGGFQCADMAEGGKMMVGARPDGTIWLFKEGKWQSKTINSPIKWISQVKFLKNSAATDIGNRPLLFTAGHDGFLRIWDDKLNMIKAISVCPGKKLLAAAVGNYNEILLAGEECIVKKIEFSE